MEASQVFAEYPCSAAVSANTASLRAGQATYCGADLQVCTSRCAGLETRTTIEGAQTVSVSVNSVLETGVRGLKAYGEVGRTTSMP